MGNNDSYEQTPESKAIEALRTEIALWIASMERDRRQELTDALDCVIPDPWGTEESDQLMLLKIWFSKIKRGEQK